MTHYTLTAVATPNPKILKLEANQFLVQGSYEYKNIDEAKDSPLAQQLFYLPFVKTVYISGNFVALERFDIVEWPAVQEALVAQLLDYLNSGQAVMLEASAKKKQPVTVYAEVTPNPGVMKFVANKRIVPAAFEFKNIDEAKDAPLVRELFHFPFVKAVFVDANYIAVSKYEVADWQDVSSQLREFIRDFLADGKEVVSATLQPKVNYDQVAQVTDDETSKAIIAILEEYVKPAVASDGGNIVFQSYEADSKTVHVVLQGACSGCPSSTLTLKNGVESLLKNKLGDTIREVVAVNG